MAAIEVTAPLDEWRPGLGPGDTQLRATAHGGVAEKP